MFDGKRRLPKCSKNFPKPYADETIVDEDSFAKPARPDDGRLVIKRGTPLDNRFIVAYNPELLCKFKMHINVEICGPIVRPQYMYKCVLP